MGSLKKAGFSLVESLLASSVLLVAMLILFQLFHVGMRYFSWVERRALATAVAERRLAELRNWSRTQNGWIGYPAGPDPLEPDFQISVTLSNYPLLTPCRELESNFADTRQMNQSARLARVRVLWNRGRIDLHTLLVDRFRGWRNPNPIEIVATIPGAVTVTSPLSLTARGFDSGGQAIADLCFSWYVEGVPPAAALGTIVPSRDGRSATFTNQSQRSDGSYAASTGQCKIKVRAIYDGQERWAETAPINLAP